MEGWRLFLVVTNAIIVFTSNFTSLGEAGPNSDYGPFREVTSSFTRWEEGKELPLFTFEGAEFNIGVDEDVSRYVGKTIVAVGTEYVIPPNTQAAEVVTGGDEVQVKTAGGREKSEKRRCREEVRGPLKGSRRREMLAAIKRARDKMSVYARVKVSSETKREDKYVPPFVRKAGSQMQRQREKVYMRVFAEGSVFDSAPERDEDCGGYENRYDVYVRVESGSHKKMVPGEQFVDASQRIERLLVGDRLVGDRSDLLADYNTHSLNLKFQYSGFIMTLQMDAQESPP